MSITRIGLSIALGAFITSAAGAKEPTRKLLIVGARIARPIELTDSLTLALSDVYAGNFLGSLRDGAPSPLLPQYEVSFYFAARRGGALFPRSRPRFARAYVVYVVPDSARHTVYVYVPGQGDTWATPNRGVIVRAEREGRWSEASAEWGRRIFDAIAQQRRLPDPTCPLPATRRLQPTDSTYRDARELTDTLEAHGLHVLCAYHSTGDGVLGIRAGAAFMTDLGPFHATFFPSAADAARLRITSAVEEGQVVTVIRGGTRERPAETFGGSDKTDFLVHGRWLIDTFGDNRLAAAVAQAIGAR